jgi:hypothetical protein
MTRKAMHTGARPETCSRVEERGQIFTLDTWLLLEKGYGTITELVKVTRRDATTLSKIARNIQARAKMNSALSDRMKLLQSELEMH